MFQPSDDVSILWYTILCYLKIGQHTKTIIISYIHLNWAIQSVN